MAEKNSKRKIDLIPHVILVFALVSILLIIVNVSANLSEAGIFIDQGGSGVEMIDTATPLPTNNAPTPTIEPVQGA